ncbi:enoyl-CoA hydratase [compost metagenome]
MQAGFLDRVVPAGEVMAVAKAAALQLKKINMVAHRNTKLKVREALLEALDQAIELDQQHFAL